MGGVMLSTINNSEFIQFLLKSELVFMKNPVITLYLSVDSIMIGREVRGNFE